MKLYKEQITDNETISEPELIGEYASLNDAQSTAEKLARDDGFDEIMWGFPINNEGQRETPYELIVRFEYKYVIRD